MKKIVLSMGIVAMSLLATDFSQMSTEELTALRGTVAVEDRDAFRTEMRSRMLAMTPEERAAYRQNRAKGNGQKLQNGSGSGNMQKGAPTQAQGIQQRLRDGSGAGSMRQGAGGAGKGRR